MSVIAVILFMLLSGVGAYVQTMTGFALGLVIMGGVGVANLMPLKDAAVVVGILALINVGVMLSRGVGDVRRKELALVLMSSLPSLAIGYLLLDHLAQAGLVWLRIILGAIIVVSSIQLILPPKKEPIESGAASFLFFGTLSGLMSGLFSTSGPPLVYHFYRQPLPVNAIKQTLVSVFGVNSLLRLLIVVSAGSFPDRPYWPAFLAIIPVVAGTQLARRLPLPISTRTLKFIVFLLLCASGLSLALPALPVVLQ
ncbi:sulfite exporter TauE/SafE family protein [Rhizobium halophytocola]|uniref:Probable membrane transporter protein n=1 Tax=Rhizobium halophytocola TaxID=735519 RepID=A0ABS4DU72_9HYPH|nr:sulfite exporter TauE/SafE family protein [Rhizobium halophytocola]MBP1849251.1 putative membrane protein YfcA [Rhizobium halophytocola]